MLEKLEQLYLNNNCIAKIENTYSLTTLQSLYLSTPPLSRLKQNRKDRKPQSAHQPQGALLGYAFSHRGNNLIDRIANLNELVYLEMLGLELNQIEVIQNLDCLTNLKLLMLGGNKIAKIEGLANLQHL